MKGQIPRQPRILFLFSDTGGGHRSASEAIIEAIYLEFGNQIATEMVDIFLDYAPRPLNLAPKLYPRMVRIPQAYSLGFRLSDGQRRTRIIEASTWPYVRRAIRNLISQHPSDLIVSAHPLANSPALRALRQNRPPFITVVTDLVSGHAFWYHRRTDLCIVPTEAARQRALAFGLRAEQIKVIGLPVADRFCQPPGDQRAIRQGLGWPLDRPVVLLVGGGEGMGPLRKTAAAIAAARLPVTLVIVAGRNTRLKAMLEAETWPMTTLVYGFVNQMPEFMQASDVLITKAGPGTICEALNAGLPMILNSRLPGQEDGNVAYIVSGGAGVWAPEPDQIIAALKNWIIYPQRRLAAKDACFAMAKPEAARQIARLLAASVGLKETQEALE